VNNRALTVALAILAAVLAVRLGISFAASHPGGQIARSPALMTLYAAASAPTFESSDISFSSISSAASSRIESWARQHGVDATYFFERRGYTLVYGSKAYSCFRFQRGNIRWIICVRDDGTLLGAQPVSATLRAPPQ
jgi:hypothetical protein